MNLLSLFVPGIFYVTIVSGNTKLWNTFAELSTIGSVPDDKQSFYIPEQNEKSYEKTSLENVSKSISNGISSVGHAQSTDVATSRTITVLQAFFLKKAIFLPGVILELLLVLFPLVLFAPALGIGALVLPVLLIVAVIAFGCLFLWVLL